MKLNQCPFCKTNVVTGKDNRCPACRRDVTDAEAVCREERLDEIYRLLWAFYQNGTSLKVALDALRHDAAFHHDAIDEAGEAFLSKGKRTFLEPGWHRVSLGVLALVGGVLATLASFVMPLPVVFVFYGAVVYGLVQIPFGVSRLLSYWRYFSC